MRPLLSICIPTHNRAEFLKVMLEALLPQVAEQGEAVEVWVLDNGSTDDSRAVVENAGRATPVRYHRNHSNLGPAKNIVRGPAALATGEYAWVLGHHNLVAPGALRRVTAALREHAATDVFYVNFRCARFPEQWPVSAAGGHDGPADYVANDETGDFTADRWEHLIRPGRSALCTQSYAPIVRTAIWRGYWGGRGIPESYSCGMTTYPHTWMLADVAFPLPARYLGRPEVTIFNGAQSWGDAATMATVYTRGLPQLLDLYADRGLPAARIAGARSFCRDQARTALRRWFSERPWPGLRLLRVLARTWRHRWLWPAAFDACADAGRGTFARAIGASRAVFPKLTAYLFRNCRPARWLRARLN